MAAIRRDKPGFAGRPNHALRGRGFLSLAAARLLVPSLLHSPPVGDAHRVIDKHGSLLVADDVGNTIWRVRPADAATARN